MMDMSVVLVSNRPSKVEMAVHQFNSQIFDGFSAELVVVQCLDETNQSLFRNIRYPPLAQVRQMKRAHSNYYDNAAAARDFGFNESTGEHVVFWDDDNLYFQHYLATMFSASVGFRLVIARARHSEHVIGDSIEPGRIDTMCICVSRELAQQVPWFDGGGGYNDYRWAKRLEEIAVPRFIPTVVGKHL